MLAQRQGSCGYWRCWPGLQLSASAALLISSTTVSGGDRTDEVGSLLGRVESGWWIHSLAEGFLPWFGAWQELGAVPPVAGCCRCPAQALLLPPLLVLPLSLLLRLPQLLLLLLLAAVVVTATAAAAAAAPAAAGLAIGRLVFGLVMCWLLLPPPWLCARQQPCCAVHSLHSGWHSGRAMVPHAVSAIPASHSPFSPTLFSALGHASHHIFLISRVSPACKAYARKPPCLTYCTPTIQCLAFSAASDVVAGAFMGALMGLLFASRAILCVGRVADGPELGGAGYAGPAASDGTPEPTHSLLLHPSNRVHDRQGFSASEVRVAV